jgi:predicted naringenin-chalcone synthase
MHTSPTTRRRSRLRPGGHGSLAGRVTRLSGLSVASPQRSFSQDEMLELLGLSGDEFARRIFARSGIRRRQFELSPSLLRSTLQGRTPATEEQHLRMAVEAIDRLEFDPAEVGLVVTSSIYALGVPTLGQRIVERYGLGAGTDKYDLYGIGCASAVPLFRLASQLLRHRPGQKALVVASESMTGFLTAVRPEDPKVKVVSSALLGDACGAALLGDGYDDPGPAVLATAVHHVSGTLDHVRLALSDGDSFGEISREMPTIAETGLPPLVDDFLSAHGLDRNAIDHWLVHPGGPAIIKGVQHGLGLSDEQVEPSVHVLSEHGNVVTAAAFLVLHATTQRRQPAAGDYGLMITVGPGVTAGLMLLRW